MSRQYRSRKRRKSTRRSRRNHQLGQRKSRRRQRSRRRSTKAKSPRRLPSRRTKRSRSVKRVSGRRRRSNMDWEYWSSFVSTPQAVCNEPFCDNTDMYAREGTEYKRLLCGGPEEFEKREGARVVVMNGHRNEGDLLDSFSIIGTPADPWAWWWSFYGITQGPTFTLADVKVLGKKMTRDYNIASGAISDLARQHANQRPSDPTLLERVFGRKEQVKEEDIFVDAPHDDRDQLERVMNAAQNISIGLSLIPADNIRTIVKSSHSAFAGCSNIRPKLPY